MKKALIKIGYWKGGASYNDQYPDVNDYIRPRWSPLTKEMVLMYLDKGKTVKHWKGSSNCRICGKENGSTELSDGTYVWPEGFSHYIEKHDVMPPEDFIERAVKCMSTDEDEDYEDS